MITLDDSCASQLFYVAYFNSTVMQSSQFGGVAPAGTMKNSVKFSPVKALSKTILSLLIP